MLRAVVILVLAFGGAVDGAVRAQPSDCAPRTAGELSAWRTFLGLGGDWLVKARAEEARRIGDDPSVFRYLDRLYLALDDDKLVILVDCPVDKGAMHYVYERYDGVGGFYVVLKTLYEGEYHVLVSKKDGSLSNAYSLPIWSPDKKHFVHGRCEPMNGPDTISIVGVAQGVLRPEATFQLPCRGLDCVIKWDDSSSVTATCAGALGSKSIRVILKGTTWSVVP